MNKLRTNYDGGMPLELDDIRFEQLAVREGFTAILSQIPVLNASGYILSGCAVTDLGASYLVGAGWVYISGEIYKVDEHEVTKGSAGCHYVFAIEVTYDPDGGETFEDTSVYDTYEVRKAKVIVNTDNPFTEVSYVQMESESGLLRLRNLIIMSFTDTETAWNSVGGSGMPAFEQSWQNLANEPVAFKKDPLGAIWLQGVAERNGSADNLVFTLPSGYRPTQQITFTDMLGGSFNSVTILANGQVTVPSGIYCNLNGITFKI